MSRVFGDQILSESRPVLWSSFVDTFRVMRQNLSSEEREYVYGLRYAYGHALYLIDSPADMLSYEYQCILSEAAMKQVQVERGICPDCGEPTFITGTCSVPCGE